MRIEIDLGDVFAEEDQSMKEAVISEIRHQVKAQVWKMVQAEAEKKIAAVVEAEVRSQIEARIAATIDMLVASGEVTRHGKLFKMTDLIASQFNESSQWGSVNACVSKLAEGYAADLKKRYDIIFASRIVMKINEEGLLKDDVAKLLLAGS